MKKLSITIMAHPSRAEFIPELQKAIGGEVPVVFDEKQNVWDTCRRAWLAQDMDAEYSLVIQDDAIVCDNFRERAEAILNKQEGDFITAFYVGKQAAHRIEQAVRKAEDHFIAGFIYNEVALCMKTKHIERMVNFCDEREAQNDHYITQWAHIARIKIYYPIPSLVDHRELVSIYRLNTNRPDADKPRRAYKFAK